MFAVKVIGFTLRKTLTFTSKKKKKITNNEVDRDLKVRKENCSRLFCLA